jgi:hypothetical protein
LWSHQVKLFALLKASTTCFKWASYSSFLTFFVMLCSLFLWLSCNSFHFSLAKQSLKFRTTSPMLILFMYNFCSFKWWHCDHFANPSIVGSFIINCFKWGPPCHLAFIIVLICFKNLQLSIKSMKCNTFFFLNHNFKIQWVTCYLH